MEKSKYIYVHLTYPIEIFENGQYKELSNCSNIEFEECTSNLSNVNISNYEIHEKITQLIRETFGENTQSNPPKIKFKNNMEHDYEFDENDSNSVCCTNDSIFSNEEMDENEEHKMQTSNVPPDTEETPQEPSNADYKLNVSKNEIRPKIVSSNKSFKNKKSKNKISRKQIV